MDDYYSLLGVDAGASVDDIRGAYRVRKDGLDTASDSGKADAAKVADLYRKQQRFAEAAKAAITQRGNLLLTKR